MRTLVSHDGSRCADDAIEDLARAGFRAACEAWFVAVADLAPAWSKRGRERFSRPLPAWDATSEVQTDSPTPRLLDSATDWDADLVVVGVRALVEEARPWRADVVFVGARGLQDGSQSIVGSVSAAVASRAPCSVEVVHAA